MPLFTFNYAVKIVDILLEKTYSLVKSLYK
jgi:hypothetical protein